MHRNLGPEKCSSSFQIIPRVSLHTSIVDNSIHILTFIYTDQMTMIWGSIFLNDRSLMSSHLLSRKVATLEGLPYWGQVLLYTTRHRCECDIIFAIFSDEDTDVKALVSSWLNKHESSAKDLLTGWIEDYFYKALEWVLKVVGRGILELIENEMDCSWHFKLWGNS